MPNVKYSIEKLIRYLVGNRRLIRAYYFGSERVPPRKEQRRFYDALRYSGIDVTVRPLKIRSKVIRCPYEDRECHQIFEIEKGVDVALVTKMLTFAFRDIYDTAILVSGDADYIEAVQTIRDLGKRVEIVSFRGSISPGLRKLADRFIALEEIVDEIKI